MSTPLTVYTRVRVTNPGRVQTQPRVPYGTEGTVVGVAYSRRTGSLRLAVAWDGYPGVMTAHINNVEAAWTTTATKLAA